MARSMVLQQNTHPRTHLHKTCFLLPLPLPLPLAFLFFLACVMANIMGFVTLTVANLWSGLSFILPSTMRPLSRTNSGRISR